MFDQSTVKIPLNPDKPTVKIGTFDRVTGRLIKAKLDREPNSDSEKDLVSDAFFGAFKHNPQVVDEAPADRKVNQALMKWAMESGSSGTQGNIAASLVSSSILWSTLTNDKTIQEALQRQAEAEEKQKEAERLEKEAIDDLPKDGIPGGGGQQGFPKEVKDKLEQAAKLRQEAEAIGNEASKKIEDTSKHPIRKQVMAKAVEEAQKAGQETAEGMAMWGVEPGVPTEQDVERILKIATDTDMQEVTRVLGRLRGLATSTIRGYKQANTGAVSKVGQTKDLTRAFPLEIMSLNASMPRIVRAKKAREWISQGLMGWIPLEEQKESGSFIFIVDESGSIGDTTCAYEKAMAIAIAKSIQDEIESGRRYELYGFDTKICTSVTSDDDWRQHVAFASEYSGGGTRITMALDHAIARAEVMDASGIEGVDIVLVSDGIDSIDKSVFDRLDDLNTRLGVRLFYIHIGTWSWSEELEKRAYATWHIANSNSFIEMVEELTKAVCEMVATR